MVGLMVLEGFYLFYKHMDAWWCKYDIFPKEMSVLIKFLGTMWGYVGHP